MRGRFAIAVFLAVLTIWTVGLVGNRLLADEGAASLGDLSGSGEAYEFKNLQGFDQVQLTFSDMLPRLTMPILSWR
jgi:hypothetical protein